jgi:dolichol-phosphate mannosyltransferase
MKSKISAIICVKNEEKSLEEVIKKARKYVDEVVVIDGHSTDSSRKIAEKLQCKVFLDNGKGKGAALRLGIRKASGDIFVFIDADGSHAIQDIPVLVRPILKGQAELVVASRGKGGSDELHGNLEKTIRLIGSAIITLMINLRFGTDLTDSQNGFRAVKASFIKRLDLKENITTIEQEMIMKTLKRKGRVKEVASHEYARKYGSSKIKLSLMSFRYLWCLIKNLF